MNTADFDFSGTDVTLDSFVNTMKFQLDVFRDTVISKHKLTAMPYWEWYEQFSAFLDLQAEGYDSMEDED